MAVRIAVAGLFLTPLVVQKTNGTWKVLKTLRYRSGVLKATIAVPPGFKTDFASVPRVPFAYWFAGNTAHQAAVIHDFLYRNPILASRRKADAVFYEAMRASGEPRWRAWLMWSAVRLAGRSAYGERRLP